MNPASDTVLTSPKPHQVAIVDSDASITNLIKLNLEDEGYGVCTFANAEDALDAGFAHTDLVITEVILSDINGLMLTGIIKSNDDTSHIPVIICTTMDSEDDIVKGFDAGADDYILKPFSLREMMARIKSVLRRRSMAARNPYRPTATASAAVKYDGLSVDTASRNVTIDGNAIALTRTELMLLNALISRPGHFYNHSDLYRIVWNKEGNASSRALDVSVSRLRKKLGKYAVHIVNRSGIGYGFIEK
ncbi:MAG: DNA-binding response regulator [Candidatus Amulumruptor caecigallinarius]|uniref:Response regulator transcription factor n=1 Tax=Candidatus Amulumruptor caecigallinarius TaxID=2109911 RepID=A0A4Q0U7Z2_9BACT|nr:MAG: DNA-binding response regulator [Candidatus Amulumruptor caecigallinarius]HJE39503.1 response regulator transcription factor [Candidatus Amulumruptor caecigallinarius]